MDWIHSLSPTPAVLAGAVALLVVLLGLLLALARAQPGQRGPRIYRAGNAVLTPAMHACLVALRAAVDDDHLVLARVPAGDVFVPRPGLRRGRQRAARRALTPLLLDFVVCAAADSRPRLVIALYDPDDPQPAETLDRACTDAGLPLLQMPRGSHYSADELRDQLRPHLRPPEIAATSADTTADGRREPILDIPDDLVDPPPNKPR